MSASSAGVGYGDAGVVGQLDWRSSVEDLTSSMIVGTRGLMDSFKAAGGAGAG